VIIVSHRGPESFVRTAEGFERRRGAGGLVSALRPALAGTGTTWVAAPVGDDDRAAVAAGVARSDEFDLRLLDLDPVTHRLHYQVVSNAVLWFLHHGLFDLPRRPTFDDRFREAWQAYEAVNERFADEVAETAGDGDTVLVQDYHLALVPGLLGARRPDLRVSYFQHTPFCGPSSMRILPSDVAGSLLTSTAAGPAGFHTRRWGRAYEACVAEVLGERGGTPPEWFAASLGPDPDALSRASADDETTAAGTLLDDRVGDRQVVVRVDRLEPSKNVVRGFAAFDRLLREHPRWRERVVFVACLYPSREGLAEYLAYRQEVEQAADRLNETWATPGWVPVLLDSEDNYHHSLAAMQRYDVLLVNPIRDGLNLVAKEGPLLNRRDGVLALSREAGAFDELGGAALAVHPYDIVQTSDALAAALDMAPAERAERAGRLQALAAARTPRDWLDDLVAHTDGTA
jgi:trehalose 6-phosphate synthase